MARVVDYEGVLQTLLAQGLKSLYYNSGSFGYPPGVATQTIGWITRPDPTIRPEALPYTRLLAGPDSKQLVDLALGLWEDCLPGVVWALPRSHWAYELDFGSREWMPAVLQRVGIDPDGLAPLTNGAAIEFRVEQESEFGGFLTQLLDNLSGSSDFQLIWPGRPAVCTVHHHRQLWWTTPNSEIYAKVSQVAVK